MIENLLEFDGSFSATPKFQVSLTAQILRPELCCHLISGSLQCLYSERRVATFDFLRSLYYGQPLTVNEAIFRIPLLQFSNQLLRLPSLATQCQPHRTPHEQYPIACERERLRCCGLILLTLAEHRIP